MKSKHSHKLKKEKHNTISLIVYGFALTISVISTLNVIFPAAFSVFFHETVVSIDPFELGIWAIPVLIANIVALTFIFLCYKKKLPSAIQGSFQRIGNFDTTPKITAIILVTIFVLYIVFSYEELFLNEQRQWADFVRIKIVLENWPFEQQGATSLKILYVKNFLLKVSEIAFQNIKIVPFIGTNALLLVTYFFTVQLTKKRFSGLIAVVLTLQSFTFLRYDTLATYSNFWTLFYILSLYLINKKWILSPISFFASIFCKALTASFLPFSLFFIYNTKMKLKKKLRITLLYIIILIMLIGALFSGVEAGGRANLEGLQIFNSENFIVGFSAWTYQLRFDPILFMFYLPVTVGLILVSRKGFREADSILVLMGGTMLAAPLMSAATGFNIFPYRYIPFLIFFAIGVSMLVSNRFTR